MRTRKIFICENFVLANIFTLGLIFYNTGLCIQYHPAIAAWLAARAGLAAPPRIAIAGAGGRALRYGENPHQRAAFYLAGGAESLRPRPGAATAEQVQGKALSYNNLADADAAFELVCEFDAPAAAVVKHANPCGAACAEEPEAAFRAARACDPLSAFGGVAAFNCALDGAAAEAVCEGFVEVVIAPAADAAARAAFARKANLRLLLTGGLADPAARETRARTVSGGLLVQERDAARVGPDGLRVVTRRRPTAAEIADLVFAFRVCKHARSNAIVFARDGRTAGIGAGQPSRVDAARVAVLKAREAAAAAGESESRLAGAAAASDAFIPFADGLAAVADAGAAAVVQPGGSVRDAEVIALADERGLAMVFTGVRHFRH